MPLMLLAGGGMNHVIIFISRYIFEKENYALSSRYALQFQVGILGIILTFALVWQLREGTNRGYRWLMALFCLAILMGNGYTTYREIQKAPSREESFERKARLALEVPGMSREELQDRGEELETEFEYRKGLDKIQSAFRILEENKLNVFREWLGQDGMGSMERGHETLRKRMRQEHYVPEIQWRTEMKVVILAGGLGTRISEESHLKPKPMIEIGGKPILWHIMKYYSEFGFHEFIICLGYKQYVVKEFFADYFLHTSDVTFDLANNKMEVHNNYSEPWKVTLVDTGLNTMTGGRVKRIQPFVGNEPFMLTYGDGVSTVDLDELVHFHKSHGRTATITTVNIGQMKGVLDIDENDTVLSFREKEDNDGALINGGFMVMNPEIFNYLEGDSTVFEQGPMQKLAAEGQLKSFYHGGFWQCMDTQREMNKLEGLWQSGKAPWKIW